MDPREKARGKRPADAIAERSRKSLKTTHDTAEEGAEVAGPVIQHTLRTLPIAVRLSTLDLTRTKVFDRNNDHLRRSLPGNEFLTLVLNELAADAGRGFFFWLPSVEVVRVAPLEARLPSSRAAKLPGTHYPTMLFTDFVWDEASRNAFFADSHRARYLKACAIINPPRRVTPLFAIQFANAINILLYHTAHDSLIILAHQEAHYLLTVADAARVLGQKPKRKSNPAAPILRPAGLWTKSSNLADEAALRSYRMEAPVLPNLYQTICQMVRRGDISPAWTGAELPSLLPRPPYPEPGVALGMGTETDVAEGDGGRVERVADPPSRRLIAHSKPGKRKTAD